jgi:AAA domain
MKYNPFQPNQIVAPGMFTGRATEVFCVEQALFQAKCGNPQHFLIEGERGIGKSSLMFLVAALADGTIKPIQAPAIRFLVLSVDLGNASNQIDIVRSIARELRSEIGRVNALKENAKRVWDFLTSWEILGVRYHKDGNSAQSDDARDDLISQIVDLCGSSESGLDGVFIIIDEADAPPVEAGLGEFLKTFTERLTRRRCNNVIIGLAGLPTLLGKLRASHESSPRIFNILSLQTLEHDERKQVVRKGLEIASTKNAFETKISDEALELLAELSEGYPHFIQQFSYNAFNSDTDNIIDVKDVINGAYDENGAIAQLGSKYFNEMYFGKISSDEYRKVLNTMAEHADNWVARKDIMNESGIKQSTIANALNALKSRNIISADPSRQGYYRLPTKSFAAWINAIKSVESRAGADHLPLFADRTDTPV